MSKLGVSQMPLPLQRFDPLDTPDFERYSDKEARDAIRSRLLRAEAAKCEEKRQPKRARNLRRLANRIDPALEDEPSTPASARYMMEKRRSIIGWLWKLVYEDDIAYRAAGQGGEPTTFTLIPARWRVPAAELRHWRPDKRLKTVREDLRVAAKKYRRKVGESRRPSGSRKIEGWAFLALHGAYDPRTDEFTTHIHGVAAGEMIAVIDELRSQRKYKPQQPYELRDAANRPVYVDRQVLSNMPNPLTYVLKSWWWIDESFVEDGLVKKYERPVRKLPRRAECQFLRFADKWRLEEVIELIGLTATREGLRRR